MFEPPKKISLRERLNISQWAIKYSWLTICLWLAITVAGVLAFSSLKYALFPDITFPVVVVNATVPEETALATEAQLTQPLEQQLQNIPGIDNIRSSTYSGQTVASLTFQVGTNLEASTATVEEVVTQLDLTPQATFKVIPLNLNESAAVSYAIHSETKTLREITQIAKEQIIPLLRELPGVLKVNLLGDAATSDNSPANEVNTLVRFNGEDSLAFQVVKRSDANTLEVVSQVEAAVGKLQNELPDVGIILAATQANYIREATQATIDALLLAIVLAVAVIFLFLRNFQATLITALAIPISLLGTSMIMAAFGFNLETITLLALALVIGIIVDDAIVDVENIIRHLETGASPRQAALIATREIGLTVSASTLTIVAVFLPVALMQGTIGQFFKPFGLTVSAAVIISLLVARTLSPVLAVYWLKSSKRENSNPVEPRESRFNRYYHNLLSWSLDHRALVLGLAILSFIAGIALIPLIPKGFIPKLDRGEFNIVYSAPLPNFQGTLPSQQTPTAAPKIEQQPEEKEKAGLQENENSFGWLTDLLKNPQKLLLNESRQVAQEIEKVVLAHPDVASVFTTVGIRGEPNKGKLYVLLEDKRQLDTIQVQEQLRESLPQLDGVAISIEDIQFIELDSTKPLKLELLGDDLTVLSQTAQKLKNRLQEMPGLVDITATGEANSTDDIVVIERSNGQRASFITANLSEDLALGDATQEAVAIAKSIIPDSITLDLGGDSKISSEVLNSFTGTLALSVGCMLLVLLLLFGRLLEPLVVGLSLPLSIVGAMLALLITQSDFGMISLIGLIFLLGLLDKNALLLMDYANQLRNQGMERRHAILKTGLVRLRPILMTTASTILGMLPIALGWGAGAELRQPMAVAIIGGLLASTLLSLIVVPVLYTLAEDCWKKLVSLGS